MRICNPDLSETANLLFEIGTEEIPAGYVPPALEQLRKIATDSLTHHRIPFGDIETLGTPRRITLSIKAIKTLQESQETEIVGPPKRVAYDENGEPTKAAIGFAKTQGVELSALRIVETERGEYVAASKLETGEPTEVVLQRLLPEWIEALRFPKTMRWETGQSGTYPPDKGGKGGSQGSGTSPPDKGGNGGSQGSGTSPLIRGARGVRRTGDFHVSPVPSDGSSHYWVTKLSTVPMAVWTQVESPMGIDPCIPNR